MSIVLSVIKSIIFTYLIFFVSCNYMWGEWDSVENHECVRHCSDPSGLMVIPRLCNYCVNQKCEVVDASECSRRLNVSEQNKTSRCYNPINCIGQGLYTGYWSDWTPTKCESIVLFDNKTCNSNLLQGLEKYQRSCLFSSKSIELQKDYENLTGNEYVPICHGISSKYKPCKVIFIGYKSS